MVEAIVRAFTALWAALQARRMTKAAADLQRGDKINQDIAADVAVLEQTSMPKEPPQ